MTDKIDEIEDTSHHKSVVDSDVVYFDSFGDEIYQVIPAKFVPRVGDTVILRTIVGDDAAREYWNVENNFPPEMEIAGVVTKVVYSVQVHLKGKTMIEVTTARVFLDCELPERDEDTDD